MDVLPPEILAHILLHACVDTGATARALSLVSRYLRDIAAPFLYQSLALSGLTQLSACAARFEAIPPHLRRVRHLFLSDWTRAEASRGSASVHASDLERYDLERELMARILSLAAGTLETLCVVVSCPYSGPPLVGHLFTLALPALRSLAVHAFYPIPHGPGTMPALERLHLSGNRNPHGLFERGTLGAACPKLADLRISGLVAAGSFAEELRDATGAREGAPSRLPQRLRTLVLEPLRLTSPQRGVARVMHAMHEKMMTTLEDVASGVGGGPEVSVVLRGARTDEIYEEMRKEWLLA